MATIEIKYGIGDKVWGFGTDYVNKKLLCPDCLGTLKWRITFADGHSEETKCFTCSRSYEGSLGYIPYSEWQPTVRELTIGKLYGFEDGRARYMCEETGIGSGTVHDEKKLFSTKEEAEAAAQTEFEARMAYLAKNNFPKEGSFANALEKDIYGFLRFEAIRKEKQMRQWLSVLDKAIKEAI